MSPPPSSSPLEGEESWTPPSLPLNKGAESVCTHLTTVVFYPTAISFERKVKTWNSKRCLCYNPFIEDFLKRRPNVNFCKEEEVEGIQMDGLESAVDVFHTAEWRLE
jgi:hypothetical protein